MVTKKGYKKILAAAETLELPDRANMETIKTSYHEMIHKWHPDKCREDPQKCKEKTREVIEAFNLIKAYCDSFEYPFSEKELERNMSDKELWFERFWNDPIWGMAPADED